MFLCSFSSQTRRNLKLTSIWKLGVCLISTLKAFTFCLLFSLQADILVFVTHHSSSPSLLQFSRELDRTPQVFLFFIYESFVFNPSSLISLMAAPPASSLVREFIISLSLQNKILIKTNMTSLFQASSSLFASNGDAGDDFLDEQ